MTSTSRSSQRLGFHVIARLAARHGIAVSLIATPGSGITAVVVLPASLFTKAVPPGPVAPLPGTAAFDGVRPNATGRSGPSVGGARDDSGRPPAGPIPGPPSNVASMAPRPASQQDAGPTGPDSRWRGWWSPETQAAADGAGGFGATGREVRDNGHDEGARAGVNGGSAHRGGSGTNGPGTDDADVDGRAINGTGVTGHCADAADGTGNGVNGHGGNGHGGNEHGGDGHTGDGHGGNGRPAPGRPEVPAADRDPDLDRPADGRKVVGDARDRTDVDGPERHTGGRVAVPEQARALPATTSDSSSPAIGIPVARAESIAVERKDCERSGHDASTPHFVRGGRPAPDQEAGMPRPHVPPVPTARKGAPPPVVDRRRPERPPIGPAVVAALPVPRTKEAVLPAVSAPRSPGSRELRRRVPQAHLAPELRHPSTGLAETAAPLSADAAASALSRYQASRLAAQAVVGDPEVNHQGREGERE